MKRFIFAVLVSMLTLSFSASAQWYLFPGGRPASDSTAVAPEKIGNVVAEPDTTFVPEVIEKIGNVVAEPDTTVWYFSEAVTRVLLTLPLKSKETPNSNFLDFYCGVLAAADEMSTEDNKIEIRVFDSSVALPSQADIDSADVILGPVSVEDIELMLPLARGKAIISPLEPKVASMLDRYNIIQAPASWDAQADELVRWLMEDLNEGDAVVLLQSNAEAGSRASSLLAFKLSELSVPFSFCAAPEELEEVAVRGRRRFVMCSEDDEFCSSAVREIALMNLRGGHNVLYGTSRLRAVPDLETESLHAAAARITAGYYADPNDFRVRDLSKRFTYLFKAEPQRWAFQGYDLMKYFGGLAKENPESWQEDLYSHPYHGLQTDFKFDYEGKVNTAVRRLKYNTNNTITVIFL